jgi:L-asparaginase/Glu-tRNA(Gln) amidotransferase subunit D
MEPFDVGVALAVTGLLLFFAVLGWVALIKRYSGFHSMLLALAVCSQVAGVWVLAASGWGQA